MHEMNTDEAMDNCESSGKWGAAEPGAGARAGVGAGAGAGAGTAEMMCALPLPQG